MDKPVRVVFLGNAKEEFQRLNEVVGLQKEKGKESTEEIQLLNSIRQKISFLRDNPFYGDNVQKYLIPKEYIINYKASNLFRVDLSHFWRMIYTVRGDQIEIVCFVLDIMSHPAYDKKFGYKKK